jgi:hypothetical protein
VFLNLHVLLAALALLIAPMARMEPLRNWVQEHAQRQGAVMPVAANAGAVAAAANAPRAASRAKSSAVVWTTMAARC